MSWVKRWTVQQIIPNETRTHLTHTFPRVAPGRMLLKSFLGRHGFPSVHSPREFGANAVLKKLVELDVNPRPLNDLCEFPRQVWIFLSTGKLDFRGLVDGNAPWPFFRHPFIQGPCCKHALLIIWFQPLVGGVSMFRSWGFPPGDSTSIYKPLVEGDCLFMEVFNFVMNKRSLLGQLFRVQAPFWGVLTLDHGNRRSHMSLITVNLLKHSVSSTFWHLVLFAIHWTWIITITMPKRRKKFETWNSRWRGLAEFWKHFRYSLVAYIKIQKSIDYHVGESICLHQHCIIQNPCLKCFSWGRSMCVKHTVCGCFFHSELCSSPFAPRIEHLYPIHVAARKGDAEMVRTGDHEIFGWFMAAFHTL